MKKILFSLILAAASVGCQVPIMPTTTVGHIVFTQQTTLVEGRTINDAPTTIEIYYTDKAARLHLTDPTPETVELLSLFDTNEEYLTFLEGNVDKSIIKVAPVITTDRKKNFYQSMVEKVLAPQASWLSTTATGPYSVTVPYFENEIDPAISQRVTIDPKNQTITKVEILNAAGDVQEVYTVTLREDVPVSYLPKDYFTLERWQDDLPGDGYSIVEEDFN